MTEVTEILYQWVQGVSQRKISNQTGTARNTVSKIINKAASLGLSQGNSCEELLLSVSTQIKASFEDNKIIKIGTTEACLAQYHDTIKSWYHEPYMTVRQIGRLLKESYPDVNVSETSLHRYIKKHFPKPVNSTCVIHTKPGEQGQVDFGYAGKMFDPVAGRNRRLYAFVMTLSYSRMRFVCFVYKQDITTWVDCHIKAFQFFGGVPATVLLDNLKAGVAKAHIYDPTINRSYAECARYYGFIADPAKVRTPTHKGKVERSIQIVRQQLLAGRTFEDIHALNHYTYSWCKDTLANEITRTTGETPRKRFERDEKAQLMALPDKPYELALWQEVKVGKDQHVTYKGSFYSVHISYVGQTVLLKATMKMIYIHHDGQPIKAHRRANRKGEWCTDVADIKESAKHFTDNTPDTCLIKAKAIGEHTHGILSDILSKAGTTRLRKAQAVLRLADKYASERLEQACQHARHFGNCSVDSLKRILNLEIDKKAICNQPTVTTEELSQGAFLRDPNEFTFH